MKKKENIIIIAILVIMLLAIIGVSYAAFSFSQTGSVPNKITTGSITMTYEESDNTITLGNALPTTDATGTTRLKDGEYFDFTVSSEITGEVNINYEISAKEVGEGTIDGSNIKLYLTRLTEDGEEQSLMTPEVYNEETTSNKFTGRPAGEMSLYTSSMNSSESNDYRLRMYVTEEYNPQGDGGNLTFAVKVNVYGKDRVGEEASKVIIENLNSGSTYDDGYDTFITGEDPNNYVWYSGKLWRAVSVNNEAKTAKLVTEWNISSIPYNPAGNTAFEGSYMEDWLNDTSVDGFLGNLREPEKFIVMDAKWNATMDNRKLGSITRPSDDGTIVTDAVGLLNAYEYQTSYRGTTYKKCYLSNKDISCATLTPYDDGYVRHIQRGLLIASSNSNFGIRPSINLKANVKIVDGDGTLDNPYRLEGDNDTNLSGALLSSRYSGEYICFGNDENNLYRIVSHENGAGTKIVSDEPLKSSGEFITSTFGSNTVFSSTNTIGAFLNGEYLTNYISSNYANMIEESNTWYLGTVGNGTSYKLAKYTDEAGTTITSSTTDAKVGLLRLGELMAGQFYIYDYNIYRNKIAYWLITPMSSDFLLRVGSNGKAHMTLLTDVENIKPTLNLKQNVVITSGDGTKNDPFNLSIN